MAITAAMVKELREATGAGPLDCQKALQAYDGSFDRAMEYLREKGLARAAKKAGRETTAGLVVVKAAGEIACVVDVACETDFVSSTREFKNFAHRAAEQVMADAALTRPEALLAAHFIDAPGKTTIDVIQELIGRLGENIVVRRLARYTATGNGIVESYVHSGAVEGFYGPGEGRIGVMVQLAANTETYDRAALGDLAHELVLHIASARPRYLAVEDVPAGVIDAQRQEFAADLAGGNKPESIKVRIIEGRMNSFLEDICLLNQAFVKDDSLTIKALLDQRRAAIGAPVSIERFVRFEVGDE